MTKPAVAEVLRFRRSAVRTMTPAIIARWLEVKHHTVLKWIHSKELPALNIGTRGKKASYLVFKKDLVIFLEQRGLRSDRIKDLLLE